LSIGLS